MKILSKLSSGHYIGLGIVTACMAALSIAYILRPIPYKESPRNYVVRGADLVNNDNLYYVKDYRTDLCYAVHKFGYESGLLTNVPCTEKVQAYIINKDSP